MHHWDTMLRKKARALLAIFCPLLFLSACALQSPFTQSSQTTGEHSQTSPLFKEVDKLQQGDTIQVDDPNFGGSLQATVLQSYFSAAGVDCKRLLIQSNTQDRKILVCNTLHQGWTPVPQAN